MELKGETAIVTGAARGLGEGIALALAREGANVLVNDCIQGNAERVVHKILAGRGRGFSFHADVTSKSEVNAMVAEALRHFGTIDILVNSAGIEARPGLLVDLPESQWDRVIEVNLKGVFLCCQAVLPTMISKGKGKIVNIASTAAIRMAFLGNADYTASQHGVAGLTEHLAWEVADQQINVNAICPGGVLTPPLEDDPSTGFRDKLVRRIVPLGRCCTPDEIGQAVVFLASERSDMITGQLLAVDGGLLTGFGEDLRSIMRRKLEEIRGTGDVLH